MDTENINLDELSLSELFGMSLVTEIMSEQEKILDNFIKGEMENE